MIHSNNDAMRINGRLVRAKTAEICSVGILYRQLSYGHSKLGAAAEVTPQEFERNLRIKIELKIRDAGNNN